MANDQASHPLCLPLGSVEAEQDDLRRLTTGRLPQPPLVLLHTIRLTVWLYSGSAGLSSDPEMEAPSDFSQMSSNLSDDDDLPSTNPIIQHRRNRSADASASTALSSSSPSVPPRLPFSGETREAQTTAEGHRRAASWAVEPKANEDGRHVRANSDEGGASRDTLATGRRTSVFSDFARATGRRTSVSSDLAQVRQGRIMLFAAVD